MEVWSSELLLCILWCLLKSIRSNYVLFFDDLKQCWLQTLRGSESVATSQYNNSTNLNARLIKYNFALNFMDYDVRICLCSQIYRITHLIKPPTRTYGCGLWRNYTKPKKGHIVKCKCSMMWSVYICIYIYIHIYMYSVYVWKFGFHWL